ncbi:hypothetical protein [Helicobacter canadensis]|uniref:Uncharacterized protein n=1 Tax=Helicobacter canadensis MIT 98-5491 TaxID=537970 RepID=C5ZXF7_9HELI|nr:hypothetical protein [Helicobacter canadensis]EES89825.1 hypothetical protein HCAN_1113 [Helicobacter canadensis MIT 98-5491]EFR48623.1 hypothetical protein HCMG_00796 [Helicobacter canadensis MIT 98-5491]STO99864.1 Uncharacterised protein [Helicobacter canadensis]
MNVTDKNSSMWNLLSQSYDAQNNNANNNISGYSSPLKNDSVFGAQEISKTDSNLFSQENSFYTPSQIQDTLEISQELSTIQNFATNFSGDLKELGESMYENGLLNKEEKMGFDILSKLNPSLDSKTTQNLLNNSNLSDENRNLLANVDKKINAVRYFGGF